MLGGDEPRLRLADDMPSTTPARSLVPFVALGVSAAALSLTTLLLLNRPVDVQGQVSALATQYQQLSDRVREQDTRTQAHQRVLDEHDELLARLRLDLNGVLVRKPPAQDTGWMIYRFNRVEQRIGTLEYQAWRQR